MFPFAYPGYDKNIIEDAHFKVSLGEIVGIIGGSGSGKTTLVNILLGFGKIRKGKIKYNEVEIIEDFSCIYEKVSYIPQNPFLIDGTI